MTRAAEPHGGPASVYLELRDLILRGDPHAHGMAPDPDLPHTWGALVELGAPDGSITLVALLDGTTSLYLSSGGATVGAGEIPDVAAAARAMLKELDLAFPAFAPTWRFPLPGPGEVRFVLLTWQGPFDATAPVEDLVGDHPLAAAWAASDRVIAQVDRVARSMGGAASGSVPPQPRRTTRPTPNGPDRR